MSGPSAEVMGLYRILDLADEKGALCGKVLAELGADVIKVEPPQGEPTRRLGPYSRNEPGLEASLRFISLNTGKRGITLNLETGQGQEIFRKLVARADGVIESFPPGYLDSLGLGYQALSALNPRIIVTSITGFGQVGPYSHFRVNDLVAFAMGGLMHISGSPEKPPCIAPETQAYYTASLFAAFGTLVALFFQQSSGRGQHVDMSIQDCLASQEHQISRYTEDGHIIRREGAQHAGAAPGNIFPCRDGYVHLFVLDKWSAFLDWMGNPEPLSDPVWQNEEFRRANIDILNACVKEFTRQRDTQDVVEQLQAKHVPCARVNKIGDLALDPHLAARNFFKVLSHPVIGEAKYVGPAFRLGITFPARHRPAPLLGQHNEEVYGQELNLSNSDLRTLQESGTI